MASIAHESSSPCPGATCAHSPKILQAFQLRPWEKLELSAWVYEQFFPVSCSYCSAFSIESARLCLFCQHLRLQHLFYCICYRIEVSLRFVLGHLSELELRSSCVFCTFILLAIQTESQAIHIKADTGDFVVLSLYLSNNSEPSGFATGASEFSNATLEVYSNFQGESTDSFMAHQDGPHKRKFNVQLRRRQRTPPDEPSTMAPIVNWERLRTWAKECLDTHIHESITLSSRENCLERLLFIDVEKHCIVSGSSSCNYVALSYVWGGHTDGITQTTKKSIDYFRKQDSLLDYDLPATIRDAMTTCRQLGVPYLWVDRLCIVQDDEMQKHEQICLMGTIYSRAFLTICATAGEHPDYGLPSVQSTPRAKVRPRTFAFGLEILVRRFPKISTWASRAWTYQEKLLSRRRLVFTDEEVFFECNQNEAAEATTPFEPPDLINQLDGFQTKIESYLFHLKVYITRKLSYKSDVFNAFAGIASSIYSSNDIIHGIPTAAFDEAVLWEVERSIPSDTRWPRQNLGKDLYIPSWSWASEFGNGLKFNADFPLLGSFAKWSYVEHQNQVRVIESVDTTFRRIHVWDDLYLDPRLYLALAWREEVIEGFPSFTTCWNQPFQVIQSHLVDRWPTYRDYWKDVTGAVLFESSSIPTIPVGRLLLRTSVAYFGLEAVPEPYLEREKRYVVYSAGATPCGWIDLLPIAAEKELPEIVPSFPKFGRRKVQLAALSCTIIYPDELFSAHKKVQKSHSLIPPPGGLNSETGGPETHINMETTYYDSEGSPLVPAPAIRVMMISWRGDVAYRVGLGVVVLRQWKTGNPTFRTIILE